MNVLVEVVLELNWTIFLYSQACYSSWNRYFYLVFLYFIEIDDIYKNLPSKNIINIITKEKSFLSIVFRGQLFNHNQNNFCAKNSSDIPRNRSLYHKEQLFYAFRFELEVI